MSTAPSATSPASSTIRGPAASRYTGVGGSLVFSNRVARPSNSAGSPASSVRSASTASRMSATFPRGRPMARAARNPGATVRQTRRGAISSSEWAAEASSSGWRTTGLDVAG